MGVRPDRDRLDVRPFRDRVAERAGGDEDRGILATEVALLAVRRNPDVGIEGWDAGGRLLARAGNGGTGFEAFITRARDDEAVAGVNRV